MLPTTVSVLCLVIVGCGGSSSTASTDAASKVTKLSVEDAAIGLMGFTNTLYEANIAETANSNILPQLLQFALKFNNGVSISEGVYINETTTGNCLYGGTLTASLISQSSTNVTFSITFNNCETKVYCPDSKEVIVNGSTTVSLTALNSTDLLMSINGSTTFSGYTSATTPCIFDTDVTYYGDYSHYTSTGTVCGYSSSVIDNIPTQVCGHN